MKYEECELELELKRGAKKIGSCASDEFFKGEGFEGQICNASWDNNH